MSGSRNLECGFEVLIPRRHNVYFPSRVEPVGPLDKWCKKKKISLLKVQDHLPNVYCKILCQEGFLTYSVTVVFAIDLILLGLHLGPGVEPS